MPDTQPTGLRDVLFDPTQVGGGRGYRYPSFYGKGVETEKNAEPEVASSGASSTPVYIPSPNLEYNFGNEGGAGDFSGDPSTPGTPTGTETDTETASNPDDRFGPSGQFSPASTGWRNETNNYGATPGWVGTAAGVAGKLPGPLGAVGTIGSGIGFINDAFGSRPEALNGTLEDTGYSWGQFKRDVFGGAFGDGLPSSGDQARNIADDRRNNPEFGDNRFGGPDTPSTSTTNQDAVGVGNLDQIDTSPIGNPSSGGDKDHSGGSGKGDRGSNPGGPSNEGSPGASGMYHSGGLTQGPNDQQSGEEFNARILENEFVLPQNVTAEIGPDILEAIRSGQIPPQLIRQALMPLVQQAQPQQPAMPTQGLRGVPMQGA